MISLEFLLSLYVAISLTIGFICLRVFLQDRSTPKTDTMSWIVLLEAALFWPLVLPLSYLERMLHRSNSPFSWVLAVSRYTHDHCLQKQNLKPSHL